MAGNKHLVPDNSTLLKSKLKALSNNLQASLQSSQFSTQEEFLFEAIKILQSFYKDLQEPIIEIPTIKTGDHPDPAIYNTLWSQLLDDLIILFTEFENIERLSLANFNFAVTESNRITSKLKQVSSKLGDYILYTNNPTKDALYFKDSFNNLTKIDNNSELLNESQCNIDQSQGIITLPVDKTKSPQVTINALPIINDDSNGTLGNNQEAGKAFNGSLDTLLDNNADTWVEYEKVVVPQSDDGEALVLDMTINLGDPKLVNFIRINPNNFGTKTIIKIDTIETSLDGAVYTSIKEDIPTATWLNENNDDLFTLAPSTSKYAGQGVYSFTPRKVKYIHFVFRQDEPYVIQTNTIDKLRYAIGLRDIHVEGVSYLSTGELISQPFANTDEIRKVSLHTNHSPLEESELGKVQYFISADNGSTWNEIRALEVSAASQIANVPNLLEYNGGSTNTINTPNPVKSLRVKTLITRNDDNFTTGSSTFNKTTATAAETHQIPFGQPFTLELNEPPIDGTVYVVDPLYGSRGFNELPYFIGFSNLLKQQSYQLPFGTLPRPVIKELSGGVYFTREANADEWIKLEVGGEEWTHIGAVTTGNIWKLDVNTGLLQLGDPIGGTVPDIDAPVAMYFEPERLFPNNDEDAHKAKLAFSTSSNQDDVRIERYDSAITIENETLQPNATIIRLKNENITEYSNIISTLNTAGFTELSYINGRDEFTSTNQWSIDVEHGTLYLTEPLSSVTTYQVDYTYQPIVVLNSTDWTWTTTSLLRDSIAIKEDKWLTISNTYSVPVTQNMRAFEVPHLALIDEGFFITLSSPTSFTSLEDPFLKEVAYIDGVTEFQKPDNGLYSVNYQYGQIFTQRPIDPNNDDWTISVEYQYSDYRVKYPIARLVNPRDYEVDIVNSTVTLKDREILKRANIPNRRLDNNAPYYIVNYDYVSEAREDIEDLQPLYTPIVRDYSLKILTKGKIF